MRCILYALLSLVIATVLEPVDASAQPTVRFATRIHSVVEAHTDVLLTLVLSEPAPPGQTLTFVIEQTPITATPDVDYIGGTIWAYAQPGDRTTLVYAHVFGDEDPEPPEEFVLEIQDGGGVYGVGSVGECRVTIVDDDSESLSAHFEIEEDVPLTPDGRIALLAADDVAIEVDMVVDDLPPGGGDVFWIDSRLPGVQTTHFVDDPRQTIVLTHAPMPPDAEPDIIELAILDPAGAKATEGGGVSAGYVPAFGAHHLGRCIACWLYYYTTSFTPETCQGYQLQENCGGYDCPDKRTAGSAGAQTGKDAVDTLETLRRYRDEVLAASPVGEYYVGLYENRSAEVMAAIIREPSLFHRANETLDLWLPAIAAQVDGVGDGFVITADMQAALLGLMDKLELHGSPELAQLVADFRVELDLEHVAGQTAAALQDALDDNPMRDEPANWGDVKAIYLNGTDR